MKRKQAKPSVFIKEQLRPSQLRTVAERRWGDADYLRNSGLNSRANGAMYLAGFVLECLLKAHLLEKYPWLQTKRKPTDLSEFNTVTWSLCYRSHDLGEILTRLPEIEDRLRSLDGRKGGLLLRSLQKVCAEWTIFVRYSPRSATIKDANDFLGNVEELKKWLA